MTCVNEIEKQKNSYYFALGFNKVLVPYQCSFRANFMRTKSNQILNKYCTFELPLLDAALPFTSKLTWKAFKFTASKVCNPIVNVEHQIA